MKSTNIWIFRNICFCTSLFCVCMKLTDLQKEKWVTTDTPLNKTSEEVLGECHTWYNCAGAYNNHYNAWIFRRFRRKIKEKMLLLDLWLANEKSRQDNNMWSPILWELSARISKVSQHLWLLILMYICILWDLDQLCCSRDLCWKIN